MRFGGHETFHIRDGWLYKGLALLNEDPKAFASDEAADMLGVGGNMVKSIRHWMAATGLAERRAKMEQAKARSFDYVPTDLGETISRWDAHFTNLATWWALHINLVNNSEFTVTWNWFFNNFSQQRFEKGVCLENLRRHLQHTSSRIPAQKTLERDMTVFLNSYARTLPAEQTDPEDSKDCPFQALGILSYFRESGFYRVEAGEKFIPTQLFAYAMAMAFPDQEGEKTSISIMEATTSPCSPGRVFCLRPESVFNLALQAEAELPSRDITVVGLAGDRRIEISAKPAHTWLKDLFITQAKTEDQWLEDQTSTLLQPY